MPEANQQICEPCRKGAPPATTQEIEAFIAAHPQWNVASGDGEPRVQREYEFSDFASALAFANQIGELAEAQQHHPLLQIEWGKVLVAWWTHKIRNIHRNDLLMAAKTEEIFGNTGDGRHNTGG